MTPQLSDLLALPGPFTTVYVDGQGNHPIPVEEAARQSIVDAVAGAGAPKNDVHAIAQAMSYTKNLPSPNTRYLVLQDGHIVFDEHYAAPRIGEAVINHGPIPLVLPALRHRRSHMCFLVVQTAREGATIAVNEAEHAAPELEHEIEGNTRRLNKAQTGGLSHRRFHSHAEEVWKANQAEVASTVEELVRAHQPTFIVLAGDVQARQLLKNHLNLGTQELLIEVDSHTKPQGADTAAVDVEVSRAVENQQQHEVERTLDAAKQNDGARAARGTTQVCAALQQAQVDTLILDAKLTESGEKIHALEAAPWVALDPGSAVGSASVGQVPLAEGLARATLLSGGRLRVFENEPAEDADFSASNELRAHQPPAEPIALLRWDNKGI